jgi:hypothetical protein
MPAGDATTRLETSAGHHKARSQGKVVNGLVLRADGEYGVSSYKKQNEAVISTKRSVYMRHANTFLEDRLGQCV